MSQIKKKMVQCQSHCHSSTHLLEQFFSLLTFFSLDKGTTEPAFFKLRNFLFNIYVNMSVASSLFPVTGVTLPFISYGGTSIIVFLSMIGILLNISRQRIKNLHVKASLALHILHRFKP